jgi:hypothetical protein
VPKIPKVGQKVQVRLPTGKEVEGVVPGYLYLELRSQTENGIRIRQVRYTVNVDQIIWQSEPRELPER